MTKRGFTLVEVLLATAILCASLVALLAGASRCLAVMKAAKNYQSAQWTLSMGEVDYPLMATNDVKRLAVDEVTYPNGFTYTRTVEDDEDKDNLYLVRITVAWPGHREGPHEEVVRYVLQQKSP
jgi:prepilin-type N-terminal cleavage/methylation domain-containing protein